MENSNRPADDYSRETPKGRVSVASRSRSLLWSASFLFLLSGATSLGYEIIWFKYFSQLWGSSSLAMGAVVASFLGGLGLGALLLGRMADRVRGPLLWYGICEATIGLLALLIPHELVVLRGLTEVFSAVGDKQWLLQGLLKFCLTSLVLLPPCLLMGGTLPLMLRQFIDAASAMKRRAGWFYAVNTFGASAGCYLVGFHLLASFGLDGTTLLLVAVNLVLGSTAILMGWSQSRLVPFSDAAVASEGSEIPESSTGPAATENRESFSHSGVGDLKLLAASAMTGCGSLILQITWARELVMILGGSTYALSAMLTVFLFGIGLGSLVFHFGLSRWQRLNQSFPLIILGLILTASLGIAAIPIVTFSVGAASTLRVSPALNSLVCLTASVALQFLPTIAMGLLFPLLLHLKERRREESGRSVGAVYASNIVGAILGATTVSLLLIPLIGIGNSVGFALLLYSTAGILLFPKLGIRYEWLLFLCFAIAAFFGSLLGTRQPDPRVTNLALFLYGFPGLEPIFNTEMLFYEEGIEANVSVTQSGGTRSLRVNGKVDASDGGDMDTQLGLAYFPLLQRPDARDVLVIGFGSGTTSGAALLFPQARVTACEIEPLVFEASRYFSEVNHAPWESEKFSIVFDDGRGFLQRTSRSFDLIISEPSNPWIAGVSNLFTREFYELAFRRMSPEGILAQWIQLYSFSPADYALVARTVLSVFPEVRLVRISNKDTLLLASKSASAFAAPIEEVQQLVDSLPAVRADLQEYFGSKDVRELLFRHVILDRRGLERFVEASLSSGENTDSNMRLEFDAPLRLYGERQSASSVDQQILAVIDASWNLQLARELELGSEQVDAFLSLVRTLRIDGKERIGPPLSTLTEAGLALDPRHPGLLRESALSHPEMDPVHFQALLEVLLEVSENESERLARDLFQRTEYAKVVEILGRLLERHPGSATAWTFLALSYAEMERQQEAEAAFQKALALDPFDRFTESAYLDFLESASDAASKEEMQK